MIVLDTHVLIWWVSGSKSLSRTAWRAIRKAIAGDMGVVISSVSVWEIAMLVRKECLVLTMPVEKWLVQVSRIEGVRFMPVDNSVCLLAATLPGTFHKDPADRMIVATARQLSATLLTADQKIIQYAHVTTVW